MPARKPRPPVEDPTQDDPAKIERFKALARELECDEDEATFDAKLKKLTQSGPIPPHEPKKRPARRTP